MYTVQTAAIATLTAEYRKARQLYAQAAANYSILQNPSHTYAAAQRAAGIPCTPDDILTAAWEGVLSLRRQFRTLSAQALALGLITYADYMVDCRL